jgi:flagellar hook-associated protein 2
MTTSVTSSTGTTSTATASSTSSSTSSSSTSSANTTSATASIISQLNAGSGIDTGSLVTQLVTAQYAAKEDQLTNQGNTLTAEISAVSSLKSDIANFSSALSTLIKGGTLSTSPTTSDSSVVNVSAMAGAKLAGLSAQVEVKQLAAAQSAATAAIADPTATIGTGTFTLTLGTATVANGQMTAFTAGSASPVSITIDSAHQSLQGIAQAINAANAGVTATIVSDSSGSRLMLKGATGADQAFTLNSSDAGLSSLNVGVGSSGTTIGTAAQDATVSLDGVDFQRSSNSFNDLISGVQMDLVSAKPGTVISIGASRPTAALSQAVTDFVDTYNQMIGEVNTDTAAQGGVLSQDTGAKNLKGLLGQMTLTQLIPSSGNGAPTTLAEIGVATQKDGTLAVNADQLSQALAKWPDQVEAMFADVTGTSVSFGPNVVTANSGVLGALNSISAGAASVTYGLGASLLKYQQAQTNLTDAQTALQQQETDTRTRLTQQFSTMDAMVASYKSTQTFLQQQIDAWNGKSSSGN